MHDTIVRPWRALGRCVPGVLALLAFVATVARGDAAKIPHLHKRLTDQAHLLSPDTHAALSQKLADYEERTTTQIAVLTVATLHGDSIEGFALKVAEASQLGAKAKDNGVLIVVARDEHKVRIEVGYGLEGQLTDLAASRITREIMAPKFKSGDYDGGIKSGVDAVITVLGGGKVPDAPGKTVDNGLPIPMAWWARVLSVLGINLFLLMFFYIGATLEAPICWLIYAFLIPFYGLTGLFLLGFAGAIASIGVYLVAFPLCHRHVKRQGKLVKAAPSSNATNSRDSFASDASSSSGGSDGPNDDLSGGGGGFGGGGASSDW